MQLSKMIQDQKEAELLSGYREKILAFGADDAALISLDEEAIEPQRADILKAAPWARSLLPYVVCMAQENLRTPARSVANLEFHQAGDQVNEVGRDMVRHLQSQGIKAINPSMGFPMEADAFPAKMWVVSHKPVAQAAGLGKIGLHRNLIHPKFGSFILLGTLITDIEVSSPAQPLDYNPCFECKLCVAACPVGALKPDGGFDFSACYTHNYREFMSGYTHHQEQAVKAKNISDYRKRVPLEESVSMWQSLSFGSNYKAAYCLSVCPAGEDVIDRYNQSKAQFKKEVLKPFQEKEEKLYVLPRSDAYYHAKKKYPHKSLRVVGNGLRSRSVHGLLFGMELTFQRGKAKGLDAKYQFEFTGKEKVKALVTIKDQTVTIEKGVEGPADLYIRADSETWLAFLAKEVSLPGAILRGKLKVKGPLKLMKRFGECFAG